MRHFLFLQGPHGSFFKKLGETLKKKGYHVSRINLCGGDWLDWHGENTWSYCGQKNLWSLWISTFFDKNNVTDLLVFGDWRPMHSEAIIIAKIKNIRVWVFEEGYLRPAYITMEQNGVNGRSELFNGSNEFVDQIYQMKCDNSLKNDPILVSGKLSKRMALAFNYGAFELLSKPFFFWYKTHRPNGILKELASWIPRLYKKRKFRKQSLEDLRKLYRAHINFFLFPLQLDSDSQVRLYSPFNGMKEAIIYILSSFAYHANKSDILVIRNHPMDNGLINYRQFIMNFSKSIGIGDRVVFVDTGNAKMMMQHTKAMVVLNSTIGMTGLENNLPVYCVGTSIYARPGLAIDKTQQTLDEFWKNPIYPDYEILRNFKELLKTTVLYNGSYYSNDGVELAINNCLLTLENEIIWRK